MTEPALWKVNSPVEAVPETTLWITHPRLPGVKCEVCGAGWAYAHRLPIELDPTIEAILQKNRGPVRVAEFNRQRDLIAASDGAAPFANYLKPGVGLGRPTVKKFKGPRSGHAYWFGYQLFVPVESLPEPDAVPPPLSHTIRCLPPFDWLAEIIPHPLPRSIYKTTLCSHCGRVDPASLDAGEYEAKLSLLSNQFGLIGVPGATVATATGREALENLAVEEIVFEPTTLARLLALAR